MPPPPVNHQPVIESSGAIFEKGFNFQTNEYEQAILSCSTQ